MKKLCLTSTPIAVIEDDPDDQELLRTIIGELDLNCEIRMFSFCEDAYDYLSSTSETPFIIFCDINLPKEDGLSFKRRVDDNPSLRQKSIPFVFLTTTANQATVDKAFTTLTIQGFFQKPTRYNEGKELITMILNYWEKCKHPNR